ncbi:pilus assembly protein [Terrimesophilobacter mesophilus]|uniref:Pilus assembly protein n=2 Tax=Terrimesophilobacter mesophilus TaxID=433647 RepID=A0A4R8VC49_9MICO|nr:TadE/TadG family type IV pilus assembly protein [Terrimesophilobacter mesophilus]TFB80884.1 pilus assembly protein [Terrimesophilobacter mesophilus]
MRAAGIRRIGRFAQDESGSAVAEFVMVGALLTVLTLSVIQLGLALLIRNTVLDAAAEGARFAALADNGLADGIERTKNLITVALGPGYARHVAAEYGTYLGHPAAIVTVEAPLPLIGLIGIDRALEVAGHAAVETLER